MTPIGEVNSCPEGGRESSGCYKGGRDESEPKRSFVGIVERKSLSQGPPEFLSVGTFSHQPTEERMSMINIIFSDFRCRLTVDSYSG